MKTALSRIGLFLGAAFMVGLIATGGATVPGRLVTNHWNASAGAAIMVVLVGGVGWLIGWLVGWGLDRLSNIRKDE